MSVTVTVTVTLTKVQVPLPSRYRRHGDDAEDDTKSGFGCRKLASALDRPFTSSLCGWRA